MARVEPRALVITYLNPASMGSQDSFRNETRQYDEMERISKKT